MSFRRKIKSVLPQWLYTPLKALDRRFYRMTIAAHRHKAGKKRFKEFNKLFCTQLDKNLYEGELAYYAKRRSIETPFPYEAMDKAVNIDVEVGYDTHNGLFYALHKGKRLYLPIDSEDGVRAQYKELIKEQSGHSPHLYVTKEFSVKCGDVVYDVGCADGMFALEHAEDAKEIYLFECDELWVKALDATFAPYAEKTHIIQKYVSDIDDAYNTRLEHYIIPGTSVFIKIDVEGYESKVLGGMGAIERCDTKIVCCTYHKGNDEAELGAFFTAHGFKTEFSEGYMLFFQDPEIKAPYFRRGLIRAHNR